MKPPLAFLRAGMFAVWALGWLLTAPATFAQTPPVTPNADLSALSLSVGALIPGFSPEITEYHENVFGASSITVTPTAAAAGASLLVNGVSVASGTASRQIGLAPNTATIIQVIVTHLGARKIYSITVNQVNPSNPSALEHQVPFDWPLIPEGVGAGDTFRLMFVTTDLARIIKVCFAPTDWVNHATKHARRNRDIAALDAFNPDQALSAKFRPLVSYGFSSEDKCAGKFLYGLSAAKITRTRPNADSATSSRIYWLNGEKVADSYADFYDSSWDSRAATHEDGSAFDTTQSIWTGTHPNGSSPQTVYIAGLGCPHSHCNRGISGEIPFYGRLDIGPGNELAAGKDSNVDTYRPIYAMSPSLRVLPPTGDRAILRDLRVTSTDGAVEMTPVFSRHNTAVTKFRTTVPSAVSSVQVIPTALDSAATIRVNGVVTSSGSGTPFDVVSGRNTTVNITVTSADETATVNYKVKLTRLEPTPPPPAIYVLPSDTTLKPAGVNDGELFRLLFVTESWANGRETDYRRYNDHVRRSAAAGHADIRAFSEEWRALVSTEFIDARALTDTTPRGNSPPIYWLGGGRVADNNRDFYDGSWQSRAPTDENGDELIAAGLRIWSGSNADGTRAQESDGGTDGLEVGGGYKNGIGRLDLGHGFELRGGSDNRNAKGNRVYAVSPQLRTPPRTDDASLGLLRVHAPPFTADSAVTLSPTFGSGVIEYTAEVDGDVQRVQVAARANAYSLDPNPTIRIFTDTDAGTASSNDNVTKTVSLFGGENPIHFEVTSSDGSATTTYTVFVTRNTGSDSPGGISTGGPGAPRGNDNSELSDLVLSDGILNPGFDAGAYTYTVNVASNVGSITVTPTAAADTSTVSVRGTPVAAGDSSAAIALVAGVAQSIPIVVTAENNTSTTYTLIATRAAASASANTNLMLLTVTTFPTPPSTPLTFTPEFVANSNISEYRTETVPNSLELVTLFAAVEMNSGAVITIDGQVLQDYYEHPVALEEGSNRVDLLVTAANAVTTRTYTVHIGRSTTVAETNADLRALSVSDGVLSPTFARATSAYSTTVAADVASVMVTPTAASATAEVRISGPGLTPDTVLANGTASGSIALKTGVNDAVRLQVRSSDRSTERAYSLAMIRNSPPEGSLGPGNQNAMANTYFEYTFDAFTDADGHELLYTADGLPASGWLNFDGTSRTFSGTPATTDIGLETVDVTISDGFDSVTRTFRVTVGVGPSLAPTGVTAVPGPEDDELTVSWTPVPDDQNGGTPPLYLATGVDTTDAAMTFTCNPFGALPNSCLLIELPPGTEYSITVTADNGFGISPPSSPAVIAGPNARPTVNIRIPSQDATVGTPFSFTIPPNTFSDDGGSSALTYSSSGQPAWFSFDGVDTWSGTPDTVDTTGVGVIVTASDGMLTRTDEFLIRVHAAPSFGEQVDDAQYTAAAAIPAMTLPPATSTLILPLTYTLHPTAGAGTFTPVAGLTFTPATRIMSGTPTNVGVTPLRYTATDKNGAAAVLTFTVTVVPTATVVTNTAPTDILLTATAIDENVAANTLVGTLSATDDTPTATEVYTLVAGDGDTDNNAFTITGTMLTINAPPDYETQPRYSIRIQVSDGLLTYAKAFPITVTDASETATFTVTTLIDARLEENLTYTSATPTTTGGTPIGALTWELGGDDAGAFTIAATGVVTLSAPDFEAPTDSGGNNTYEFTLTATDVDGNTDTSAVTTITITDVNEVADFTVTALADASINENTLYVSDPPATTGDTPIGALTWALGGDDVGAFTIAAATGVVTLSAPDFDTPTDSDRDNVYTFTLTATDEDNNTDTSAVTTISVIDMTEPAIFTVTALADASINENTPYVSDPPATTGDTPIGALAWTLGGDDAGAFTIAAATGVVTLSAPDFEMPTDSDSDNVYTFTLTATDEDNNTNTSAVTTITVTDVTEPATFTVTALADASINENTLYVSGPPATTGDTPIGTVIWTLGGDDAALFTIDDATGVVTLEPRNFEVPTDAGNDNTYQFTLIATDADGNTDADNNAGTSAVTTISIINEIIEIANFGVRPLASASIEENMTYTSPPPDTTGATPVGTVTWTLDGPDAAAFDIVPATGVVTLTPRDYEAPNDTGNDNTYQFTLIATDEGGNDASSAVTTITIIDVMETATFTVTALISERIDENTIYISATPATTGDTPIGAVIWSLGGADSSEFTIDANTGVVTLSPRDFEMPTDTDAGNYNTYQFTLIATDADNNTATSAVTTITIINEIIETANFGVPPLASASIAENMTYTSATPVTTGATPVGTVTWTLDGPDAAAFDIAPATGVVTLTPRDYEAPTDTGADNTYEFTLIATDEGGNDATSAPTTITIINVAELTMTDVVVDEGDGVATVTVRLDNAVSGGFTVDASTSDATATSEATATEIADYTALTSTLTFAGTDGETQAITIDIIDDAMAEGEETMTVSLSNLQGTVVAVGLPAGATVTITDNDNPGLMLTPATLTVTEGTAATYTVALATQPTNAVTVTIASANASVASSSTAMTFTSADWGMPQPVTVTTAEDAGGVPGDTTLTHTAENGGYAGIAANLVVTVSSTSAATIAATAHQNEQILTRASQAITANTLAAVAGRVNVATDGGALAPAYQFGGQSSLRGLLETHGAAMLQGTMEYESLLDDASFVLPLLTAGEDADGGAGGGSMAVWGAANYNNMNGDSDVLDWEGRLRSTSFGVDGLLSEDTLAGVALSLHSGRFDYHDESGGTARNGEYEYSITALYPYLGWFPNDKFSMWAATGYGRGEIEIAEEGADERSTGATQVSLAGGFNNRILRAAGLLPGSVTTLNLKSDVSAVQVEVDEDEEAQFAEQEIDSHHLRLLVSGEQRSKLLSGGSLASSLEVGVRYDGGDGVTGSGIEAGTGLHYANSGGNLTASGNIRGMRLDDYDEWGVDVVFQLLPPDGRGLSFRLHPVWGRTQSAAEQLWNENAGELGGGEVVLQGSLAAEVGYGVSASMLGTAGVLTPFMGMTMGDSGSNRVRLGGRFSGGTGLILNLEGARENSEDGATHTVLLRGGLAF